MPVLPCRLPRDTELPVLAVFAGLLGQQARIAIPFPSVGAFSWESYVILSKGVRERRKGEGYLRPPNWCALRDGITVTHGGEFWHASGVFSGLLYVCLCFSSSG